MKVLTTTEFTKKFQGLDSSTQNKILATVKELEGQSSESISKRVMESKSLYTEKQVYVMRVGPNIRLFFTMGDDKSVILLDLVLRLTQETSQISPPPSKNPRTNKNVDPSVNASINPILNASLNPLLNASINPILNASINPILNASINPVLNASINPVLNASINPLLNSSLNPVLNYSINPRLNPAYDGPFLYDRNLYETGFVVRANDAVILIFKSDLDFSGIGVRNSIQGYTLFDRANNWTGQLIPNGKGGYNQFSKDNEWIGFAV